VNKKKPPDKIIAPPGTPHEPAPPPPQQLNAAELEAEKRAIGVVDSPLAKEGLHEELPAEKPAPVLEPIPAKRVHATQLFPHLSFIKDAEGRKMALPRRTGGQYSARRLVMINLFSGEERTDWVTPGLLPQQWGVKEFERFSDPSKYKEDTKYGNIEVIFDFQWQLLSFWKGLGRKAPIWDPLYRNDYDSTRFPPDVRLPPPPGAIPTEGTR